MPLDYCDIYMRLIDDITQSCDYNFYCHISIYWLMILSIDNYRSGLIITLIFSYNKMMININLLCVVIKC